VGASCVSLCEVCVSVSWMSNVSFMLKSFMLKSVQQ